MEIKSISGAVLYKNDKLKNMKDLVQEALKSNVNLSRADLTTADLQGIKVGQNASINFTEANLSRAMLSVSELFGADFSRANLAQAAFFGAKLQNACFAGANLTNAVLIKADLSNANFSGAILMGADMTNAILTGTNMDGVKK